MKENMRKQKREDHMEKDEKQKSRTSRQKLG